MRADQIPHRLREIAEEIPEEAARTDPTGDMRALRELIAEAANLANEHPDATPGSLVDVLAEVLESCVFGLRAIADSNRPSSRFG